MGVKLLWESGLPDSALLSLFRDDVLVWQGQGAEYSDHWLLLRQDYHYQLKSEVQGQLFSSNSIAVQAGDSVAPSPVSNLQAKESSGQIVLSWHAAEDNVAIAGYKVFRNGEPYGWQANTTFIDSWPPVGQITYEVIAADTSENNSAAQIIIMEISRNE